MKEKEEEKVRLSTKIERIWFIYKEVGKLALKATPFYVFVVLSTNIVIALLTIPLLYVDKLVLDKIVESVGLVEWRSAVYVIGLLISLRIFLQIFNNVLRNVGFYFRTMVSDHLSTEIELMVGKKLSQIDMEVIDQPSFKDKYQNVRSSSNRVWSLLYSFFDIPSSLIGFFSMIGILFVLNPFIAIGVFVVSLPQFYANTKISKARYANDKKMSAMYRIRNWFGSYLNPSDNYLELKLLDLTEHLQKSYKEINLKIVNNDLKIRRNNNILDNLSQLSADVLEFVVSVSLIVSVILREITVGSFQLYISALSRAQRDLEGLLSSLVRIYEDYIYVSDLVWFLNLDSKIETAEVGKVPDNQFDIEFKNVWFRYQDDQPWILKDISFKITSKENIAIVGVNGTGKSTLIKLLARFYDPQKGTILVKGEDLKELDVKLWRKKLAVLLQEFDDYAFTAKDSIGYGDIARLDSLNEIKESAKLTDMHNFIQNLPLKYDNPLSTSFEGGINPSTGQRQRIGISRMLFRKNASVIVMDEPTSSVDPEAEMRIFKELAIQAKDKILIFVTQRFSTVRLADRIFVIENGQLIESGTHDELMAYSKKYAKLFALQAKGYK